MTADEARSLLATFQRGRERGAAADVWGPLDRLEEALRTVVAREDEATAARAALREAMPDPVGAFSADGASLASLVELLAARLRAAMTEIQAADVEREYSRKIIDTLPLCSFCGAIATGVTYPPDTDGPADRCDDHTVENYETHSYPYADAVRAWRGAR